MNWRGQKPGAHQRYQPQASPTSPQCTKPQTSYSGQRKKKGAKGEEGPTQLPRPPREAKGTQPPRAKRREPTSMGTRKAQARAGRDSPTSSASLEALPETAPKCHDSDNRKECRAGPEASPHRTHNNPYK